MAVPTTTRYTAEDLFLLPGDAWYELIRGELRDASPTSMKLSLIGGKRFRLLADFVDAHGLGYVTPADGGYLLRRRPDTVVAPDVGFVRKERLPSGVPERGHCPVPPDLAIEVTSPTDRLGHMEEKLAAYLDAGVQVWWIDLLPRRARLYRPGRPVQVLHPGDVLDGEEALPGFRVSVATIFE